MKISQGEYFIARDGARNYLARALETSTSGSVEAVYEKDCHIPDARHTLTVRSEDLVVNLGATPQPGKVYDCDVSNLYYKSKAHDDFGHVYWFYKPPKQVVTDLWAAMDRVAKKLRKFGLEFLLEDLIWEIQPWCGIGKYAGMYRRSKGERLPRIWTRPEIMPATEYEYVLLHELGHHLHFKYVTGQMLNAKWLQLFNTSIRVATVRKDESADLLEELLAGEEAPSNFKGQLDEEKALAFKWIIRTIGQVNALGIKELDTLFEAGLKDSIRKVWPVRTIPRKELAPIISEYATKNFRETFAEAFSFHLLKRPLPDPVIRMVEKSISYSKTQVEK